MNCEDLNRRWKNSMASQVLVMTQSNSLIIKNLILEWAVGKSDKIHEIKKRVLRKMVSFPNDLFDLMAENINCVVIYKIICHIFWECER